MKQVKTGHDDCCKKNTTTENRENGTQITAVRNNASA